jgi:methyl-accepting chemotaxis protein
MKIRSQIVIVSFSLVVISVACTSITAMRYFIDFMQKSAKEEAEHSIAGFKENIRADMERTRTFRDRLIENPDLPRLVSERDTEGLLKLTIPLLQAANVDIMMIAAADGKVLARPHDPKRFGDSVAANPDVQNALRGNTYEMFMTATSTRLGYYCGTPVRYNGRIVGVVRTAFYLENSNLVDKVKALFGAEATIFADKTMLSTTFQENGQRIAGTDAPQDVIDRVLQEGEDYFGDMGFLGSVYLTHYTPLKDPSSGKTVGMLFTGKPMEGMYSAIRISLAAVGMVSLVVLAAAFFVSFWLARRISKPLNRIALLSERGKNGDLTITEDDFDCRRRDELGTLAGSLSGMIAFQRAAVSQVISTSDTVTEHTKDLASLSQENSDAMRRTRSLIDEVSRLCNTNADAVEKGHMAISEMAHGAGAVAQMSVNGATSLEKTTKISKDAAESVNDLVEHIGIVDAKTMENQSKMKELSGSVSEISNFMGVITSIADQTNLLALNAAIEAARAGESGRGFAVVAEEVRKLAEDSRSASKNVDALVTTLSKTAGDAISATEDSVEIVKRITSMANVAVEGLNSGLREITSANEAIQSIAAVAEEQAAASSEITNAIDAISKGTGEISHKMSDLLGLSNQASTVGSSVSDAADEMYQSAEEMKELLSRFKVSAQR